MRPQCAGALCALENSCTGGAVGRIRTSRPSAADPRLALVGDRSLEQGGVTTENSVELAKEQGLNSVLKRLAQAAGFRVNPHVAHPVATRNGSHPIVRISLWVLGESAPNGNPRQSGEAEEDDDDEGNQGRAARNVSH
jgi:hypothetical protein